MSEGEGYKGTKVEVLDSGFIRLVDWMGSDLSIVRAARNSYDAAWRAGLSEGSDAKLIRYLMTNSHSTPFEAVEFQFEVKMPIFIMRQWVRHRTHSFNEVSARYTELPEEFYIPDINKIGIQSTVNKQGREVAVADKSDELLEYERNIYISSCQRSFVVYRSLLEWGWPRELARAVLPLSTYTKTFDKVNLWNLFKFLDLRSSQLNAHAQWEFQVYANTIIDLVEPIVPVAFRAWKERNTKWKIMEELYKKWAAENPEAANFSGEK